MKTPCMGGFCALRDHCPHYFVKSKAEPSERLCYPGEDGHSDVVSVRLTRAVGTWEGALSAIPATPFGGLAS